MKPYVSILNTPKRNYNRGLAFLDMASTSEAKADFDTALKFAEQQRNSTIKSQIEQAMNKLNRAD